MIDQQSPWRTVDDVELAMLSWVILFNNQRLHGTLDDIPPVEFETDYPRQQQTNQPVEIQRTACPSDPGWISPAQGHA